MLSLSAEIINTKAPYHVVKGEENSFYFTTDGGVVYNVGFVQDQMLADEGVYQFYIVNVNHDHERRDALVWETIRCVIEVFFQQEPLVMLYICDTSDERQDVRDRLFKRWYREYANPIEFTLVNEHIEFDGIVYFGSILLKKSHPNHDELISKFHHIIMDLPNKLDNL